MKSLLTVVMTFSIFANLSGQERFSPGYYVTNSQDTVRGYVLNKAYYSTQILFRPTISSRAQTLTVNDVKSFVLSSGEVYVSMKFANGTQLPTTSTFVRMIVAGGIDLLSYRGVYIIGSEDKGRFALAKGKNSNATTGLKNYQINTGIFNMLFQDCPSVKAEAENVPMVEEKLSQLIKSYNACRSLPHREFYTKKLKRVSQIGFFIGQSRAKISFPGSEILRSSDFLFRSKFPVSLQPTFGILGLRSGRGTRSMFGLQGELTFTRVRFSSTSVYTNDVAGYDVKEIARTNLDYSLLTFRGGLRLTGRSHTVNPYVSFGLGHQMSIAPKSTITMRREINASYEEETFDADLTQTGLVIWAAAGLKKDVFGKHAIFLDGNYEENFASSSGKVSSLVVRLGFLF